VNRAYLAAHRPDEIAVDTIKMDDDQDVNECDTSVEIDQMWSYVGQKVHQRWLWHAIDRAMGAVLAYIQGKRQDEVFLE
jgi:insertion element IS1 protein InsB